MKSKKRISAILAFVGVPLLALVYSFSSMDPVYMPRFTYTAIYIGVITLAGIFLLPTKSWAFVNSILRSRIFLPFLLFLATAIIALTNSHSLPESLLFIGKDLIFFTLILTLIAFFQADDSLQNTVIKGLLIGLLISLSIGFYQLYYLWEEVGINRESLYDLSSTLGHRNLFASLLAIGLSFSVYGFLQFKRFWRILSLITGLISIGFVIGLQARSSWLALTSFVVFLGVIKLLIRRSINPAKWVNKWSVVSLITIVLIAYTSVMVGGDEKLRGQELRFDIKLENSSNKTFTIHERALLWKGSLRMVKDNSQLGVGPGNWKVHFPKYGSDIWRARQGQVQFQRPHNDFLWVFTEQGVAGLLAYIMIFVAVFYCGFKVLFSVKAKSQDRILVQLLLSGLIAYLVVAFFSFPRERIFHQWVLYISFALILSIYFRNNDFKNSGAKLSILLPSVIVIIAALNFFVGVDRWKGEVLTSKILQAKAMKQWQKMKNLSDEVQTYNFYDMDPTSVPIPFYKGLAELNIGNNPKALENFEYAYAIHPNNIHVVNNLASVHQLLNHPEQAIAFYEKALSISPKYLDGTLNLAATLFNNNEVIKAHKVLLDHKSDFPEEDERYRAYSLTMLKVIQENLASQINDSTLSDAILKINEDWLFQIHEKVAIDSTEINKKLIEDAIFGLESLTNQISPKQAEDFRNLYLNKYEF